MLLEKEGKVEVYVRKGPVSRRGFLLYGKGGGGFEITPYEVFIFDMYRFYMLHYITTHTSIYHFTIIFNVTTVLIKGFTYNTQ